MEHNRESVLIWRCISASGVSDIVSDIGGIMNAEKYRQVLIYHAIPSGKRLFVNGFTFHHDSDPKHAASAVKSCLSRKTVNKQSWTSLHRFQT